MSADKPLTAEEIAQARFLTDLNPSDRCNVSKTLLRRLCDAAESAAKNVKAQQLQDSIDRVADALSTARQRAEQAEAEAARLRAELERAQADAWIPVGERLPASWNDYLVVMDARGTMEVASFQLHDGGTDGKKAGRWYIDGDEVYPTHWRHLPEPPAASQPQPEGGERD